MINSAKHISFFNRKFKSIIDVYSHPQKDKLIAEVNRFYDYYTAVDTLGYKFGLEIMCVAVDEGRKEVYIPVLRTKTMQNGRIFLSEKRLSSPSEDINSCYGTLAKEWIYAILKNENFSNGKSIYE